LFILDLRHFEEKVEREVHEVMGKELIERKYRKC